MKLTDVLVEDAEWYGGRSMRSVFIALLRYRTFRPVFTLRMAQATRGPIQWAFRVMHHWVCQRATIDLWPTTHVGPGFKITHGWGSVVNPRTVIGRDVVMMHGVTLGQSGREGRSPKIGDRVFLGPGCAVLGGITVGDGATVSAGCVVTQDVPPETLVILERASIVMKPYVRPYGKSNPAPSA